MTKTTMTAVFKRGRAAVVSYLRMLNLGWRGSFGSRAAVTKDIEALRPEANDTSPEGFSTPHSEESV